MSHRKKAAALVLAAGFSSRMESLKSLLPLGSSSVIQSTVSSFIKAGITDITAVLGHRAAEIVPELLPLNIQIVINDEYREGMYSSVQRGVRTLPSDVEAFFLLPVDYPLVRPDTIRKIYAAYERAQVGIVYPTYLKKRGHPPLISSRYKEEILSGVEPEGLRGFLGKYEAEAIEVPVDDRGILLDIDTPDDYSLINGFAQFGDIPDEYACQLILEYFKVPERVMAHSRVVADLAVSMAVMLNSCGSKLDVSLINAAALLHDLAKGQENHAETGAMYMRILGFSRLAPLVETHMDFVFSPEEGIREAALVYLADKLTARRGMHN
jgi:molybdenum cofactor cytidylyltransferase